MSKIVELMKKLYLPISDKKNYVVVSIRMYTTSKNINQFRKALKLGTVSKRDRKSRF